MIYQGGFLLADVMVALVICGVTMAPSGLPARVLGLRPAGLRGQDLLRAVPLALARRPRDRQRSDGTDGLQPLCPAQRLTAFVIAVLSWYLVESPIRSGGSPTGAAGLDPGRAATAVTCASPPLYCAAVPTANGIDADLPRLNIQQHREGGLLRLHLPRTARNG